MKVESTPLDGLKIIIPSCYQDKRGYFYESWQAKQFLDLGIKADFVQDNVSFSRENVLRGMHFQIKTAFAQLVTVTLGHIFDAVVDLRHSSPTFGQWYARELRADKPEQIYIPPGFAHGFCVLSKEALVNYKCTDYYHPQDEGGVRWDSIDIPWPIKNPIISEKDQKLLPLAQLTPDNLPVYEDLSHAKAIYR